MKVKELVGNIDKLYDQRIEIIGYISVTRLFSYMWANENIEEKCDNYVLILDDSIFKYLESAKIPTLVGTPVIYGGWTKLVGRVYTNSGFPMFSAVIKSISEISFEYETVNEFDEIKNYVIHKKFFEPKINLYLQGGMPLNNKQVQTIKHIVKGSDNFIAIKNEFSKEGKHLLAFHLDTFSLEQLKTQLEQEGITNYFWEYSENN